MFPNTILAKNQQGKKALSLNLAFPDTHLVEYAARAGQVQKFFIWGDEEKPGGKWPANVFQGRFPYQNTVEDGYPGTSPVGKFPANAFGLHDMAGNVWEWTLPAKIRLNLEEDLPGGKLVDDDNHAFIRGGNYRSTALSVSNDFNSIEVGPGDIERLTRLDNSRAADAVGFRCAWDEEDRQDFGGQGPLAEPACPLP